eukprot:TRINITY_DN10554_c0_g1_i1.p1 TRINITY_DN10554_c0_g1~~TRINITY_DN10554_c0_g1_i1.p1  ORF type:complete len:576 (+),score=166.90 TRINITY_DN10554_c0_g1_i1:138-1865(+)
MEEEIDMDVQFQGVHYPIFVDDVPEIPEVPEINPHGHIPGILPNVQQQLPAKKPIQVDQASMERIVVNILGIIPQINKEFLRTQIKEVSREIADAGAIEIQVVDIVLNMDTFPVEEQVQIEMKKQVTAPPKPKKIYDFEDTEEPVDGLYKTGALDYLKGYFNQLSLRDIRSVFGDKNGHLFPTARLLDEKIAEGKIKLLKSLRKHVEHMPEPLSNNGDDENDEQDDRLRIEIEHFETWKRNKAEAANLKVAQQLQNEVAEEEGTEMECQCCCMDVSIEMMVQCTEGCLFCQRCLGSTVNEQIFGQNKTEQRVRCVNPSNPDCQGFFRDDMLKRSLEPKVYEKYQKKTALSACGEIDGLYTCPMCDNPAICQEKEFDCPFCGNKFCTECNKKAHPGIRCDQVETKNEENLRKFMEEKMTEARLRKCHKCKQPFVKVEGCNKMTCTCGAIMCYICRKKIAGYDHFCRVAHCKHKTCGKCRLFTNTLEDDRLAVAETARLAKEEFVTDDKNAINLKNMAMIDALIESAEKEAGIKKGSKKRKAPVAAAAGEVNDEPPAFQPLNRIIRGRGRVRARGRR